MPPIAVVSAHQPSGKGCVLDVAAGVNGTGGGAERSAHGKAGIGGVGALAYRARGLEQLAIHQRRTAGSRVFALAFMAWPPLDRYARHIPPIGRF